jgi:hypothetical protein
MRPATLAEIVDRILAGEPLEKALPEFLDTFYLAPSPEARMACLTEEPRLTGDIRLDALMGAVADYLAGLYRLPDVPEWAFGARRFLDEPWHAAPFDTPGMREYLTFASPAEFRSRNIFTEERPLRRARSHLPFQAKETAASAKSQ